MNLYTNDSIQYHNIIFQKPIQNKLEMYKNFYKILYTLPTYTMNYLLVPIRLKHYNIEHSNNKYKLIVDKNDPFFNLVFELEKRILSKLSNVVQKSIKQQCIFDLRNKKYLFVFHHMPNLDNLCLKISGVWEDEHYIGMIYKIFYYSSSYESPST